MTSVRLAIGLAWMLWMGCEAWAATCPLHLVTIEQDGVASEGSKDKLRDAVRAGLPVRVGWSLNFDEDPEPEVRHWSDSGFLTEFEGEIFAQFADIQGDEGRTVRRCSSRLSNSLRVGRSIRHAGETGKRGARRRAGVPDDHERERAVRADA